MMWTHIGNKLKSFFARPHPVTSILHRWPDEVSDLIVIPAGPHKGIWFHDGQPPREQMDMAWHFGAVMAEHGYSYDPGGDWWVGSFSNNVGGLERINIPAEAHCVDEERWLHLIGLVVVGQGWRVVEPNSVANHRTSPLGANYMLYRASRGWDKARLRKFERRNGYDPR